MKNKFIIALTLCTTLVNSTPILVNAATEPTEISDKQNEESKKSKPNMAPSFKEEFDKMNEGYSKLTPTQKAEIDKLLDENYKNQETIIDKLVEFNVLDKQTAVTYKQHLKDRHNRKKSDGVIFGRKHADAPIKDAPPKEEKK